MKERAKAALVIAHPGHELRVHGWLENARPLVSVLTDGSGHVGTSRLHRTTRILEAAGARPGSVYGRYTDAAIYSAVMAGNSMLFAGLARELASQFRVHGIDLVAMDAVEGYNPSHDLCHVVASAAVAAARATGRTIEAVEFDLVAAPGRCPAGQLTDAIVVDLDADALTRKLDAAREYPELAEDVRVALERFGPGAFSREVLRPADLDAGREWPAGTQPFCERHGERRAAEGLYRDVLRFEQHIRPMAARIWQCGGTVEPGARTVAASGQ
jgi:hypothetical protein